MERKLKIPAGEEVWVNYFNSAHELKFVVTSKVLRDFYFLYEVDGDKLKKLGKAQSPKDLEEKFRVIDIIRQ